MAKRASSAFSLDEWLEDINKKQSLLDFNFQTLNRSYGTHRKSCWQCASKKSKPTTSFEADRCQPMLHIYKVLWDSVLFDGDSTIYLSKPEIVGIDGIIYGGETCSTYRSASAKFYKAAFYQMKKEDRTKLGEYLPHCKHSIVNNHQLGNFMPIPKHGGINGSRNGIFGRYYPYNYFDLYLRHVRSFARFRKPAATYSAEKRADKHTVKYEVSERLKEAIETNAAYFSRFGSFEDYIQKNYLEGYILTRENFAFFKELIPSLTKKAIGDIVPLYEVDSMRNYKDALEDPTGGIIVNRGKTMLRELKNALQAESQEA